MSEKMKQIKVYFPIDDFKKLKNISKSQSITMSEFLRNSVNTKLENAPLPKSKKIYKATDPKLLFELNKIGNNLNQIARQLNSKKDDVSNITILKELVELEKKMSNLL